MAVAVEADTITDPGTVELFDTRGRHLRTIPAGALPDMLTFTKGARGLLVANEGEPADGVDPEGSVTVIDLRRGLRHPRVRTARLDGVPIRGEVRSATPGIPFGQDAEPEYIALGRGGEGPEAEGVDVGEVRGRPYTFLGAERQGGLFAYDLLAAKGEARLAGYVNTRPDDLGPEGVRFVAGHDSPTGSPLVLVTNEISGTLAVFAVRPR